MGPKCAGRRNEGGCGSIARHGSRYCYQHEPELLEQRAEERRKEAEREANKPPKRYCATCNNFAAADSEWCWQHDGVREELPLCRGTNLSGDPCRRRVSERFPWCHNHRQQDPDLRLRLAKLNGSYAIGLQEPASSEHEDEGDELDDASFWDEPSAPGEDEENERLELERKRRLQLCRDAERRLGVVLTKLAAYRALLAEMHQELRDCERRIGALPDSK